MQIIQKYWPKGQICCFKVYPKDEVGYDHFYYVRVFRSPRSMRLYVNDNKVNGSASMQCLGFCSSWHIKSRKTLERGRIKTRLKLGEIFFNRDNLGARVVSHEMTHAALGYARAMGVMLVGPQPGARSVGDEEELVCYAVGDMTARTYDKLREYGLIAG